MYNFSQHALPVIDIACFLGGIAVSSSEDRTCKVRMQLYSALNLALCSNADVTFVPVQNLVILIYSIYQ
jgi:pre-rRNA-processing protein IPI3